MKRFTRNEKGFTLIELMIVIAIIGILAAVAIPNYISFRDKGYCSGAESDANSILGTISDYYAIPSHTASVADAGGIPTSGGTVAGVTYKALSNGNTATVAGAAAATMSVTVTDASGRCPDAYQTSQSNAGWNAAANTFRKTM